ncbi:MAG: hypothetical protein Q7T18_02140 [Sedimentisphaerales bacterium]|nr:hypothetical protein [Sedimentisphaerales bacterium]
MTLDEHVDFAEKLYAIRAEVMADRLNKYPKTSKQVRAIWNLYHAIDAARSKMDDAFYQEYPGAEYRRPHKPWTHTPYFWNREDGKDEPQT